MENEKVSVVIATYKRGNEYLKKALLSVVNQTYKNIEIIVVDDNGDKSFSDKTESVIEEVKKDYPDANIVLYLNEKNVGSAASRNKGIELATGKYVGFLDDDDYYLPEKTEKQLAYFIENNLDYCVSDLELYDENGKLTQRRVRDYIKETDTLSLLKYHFCHHITGTSTLMFTKDYLVKIGCFEPIDIGDEFYLMNKAITGGGKFGYFKGVYVHAISHGSEGLSSGENKIKGENGLYQFKKERLKGFDRKTIRFIKMRHFLVIAFANFKAKRFIKTAGNLIASFFIAPVACLKLILTRNA